MGIMRIMTDRAIRALQTAAVVTGVLGSALAMGASTAAPVKAAEIKVCYEDWYPYSFPTDAGGHEGVQVAITTRAFEAMGHTVTFSELPYKRCVHETVIGTFDAMLLTDSEPEMLRGTVSTASWLLGFYVQNTNSLTGFDGLESFANMRLGVVDGYEYPEPIETFTRWTRDSVTDAETNLRKLDAGRVDLVLDDVLWVEAVAQREGYALKRLKPLFSAVPQFTHFSPQREDLVAPYDAALKALLADGTVDRLYQETVGTPFSDLTADLSVFYDEE